MIDTLAEARKRAKDVYNSCGNNEGRKKMILQIFPDLLMSEAEKALNDLELAWGEADTDAFNDAKDRIAEMLKNPSDCKTVKVEGAFLEPYWVDGKGVFVPVINKVVAPKDLPEEMNWDDAMKATDGKMGTKRDWAFIYAWKQEINALLEQHGAEKIRDVWYWTETEYSATDAWYLNFNNGNQNGDGKSTHRYRVRPVSAL